MLVPAYNENVTSRLRRGDNTVTKQFTPTGALLPGVQEILRIFRSDDEWRLMSYFLGQRGQLGDRRPLDLLRHGEKEKVLKHACVHAEENTW